MFPLFLTKLDYAYMFIFVFSLILIIAFFTLIERKTLASIQKRKGPDKSGFFGLFQPILDALKLVFKETILPKNSYIFLFLLSPILIFSLSLLIWSLFPLTKYGSIFSSNYSLLWVLLLSSISTFSLFLSGWSSNCKYAFLGSIRSVTQMISYEISLSFLILPIIYITGSFNLESIFFTQHFSGVINASFLLPNAFLFFICILAETNRAPFDLPEAEAELVAGYNVEYSSIPFAYFFLGEYLNILSMSFLFFILFFGKWFYYNNSILQSVFLMIILFFIINIIIWIRATFPRLRYDYLLIFCWKYCLIFSFSYFIFFLLSHIIVFKTVTFWTAFWARCSPRIKFMIILVLLWPVYNGIAIYISFMFGWAFSRSFYEENKKYYPKGYKQKGV